MCNHNAAIKWDDSYSPPAAFCDRCGAYLGRSIPGVPA